MGVYYPLILFSRETRKAVEQHYPGFTVDAIDENLPILVSICEPCATGDHMYFFHTIDETTKKLYYAYGCSNCHKHAALAETKELALENWMKLNGKTLLQGTN